MCVVLIGVLCLNCLYMSSPHLVPVVFGTAIPTPPLHLESVLHKMSIKNKLCFGREKFSFCKNNVQVRHVFNTDDETFTFLQSVWCVLFRDLGKVASKHCSWHVSTFNLHTWTQKSTCSEVVTHIFQQKRPLCKKS